MKEEKNIDKFLLRSLDTIMSDRFARYSKYIIQQRALPDAKDGLKPVQRRILYSMWELGLKNDKPFKKSARVVGDVIGKYHPHGDSSIYEALVRMAQEWKMNIPLVQMHGNKGSIDDDPAAAMRYTETRLEKITNLMLEGIDKKTVPFAPNFDDSEVEPTVLPTMIPNLLINGAKGIAAGFATEIPPHNLGEILDAAIAKIKNPAIELRQLFKIVKGPDFPTGGTIYGTRGIYDAFERGQGRIVLVSKYRISNEENKKYIEIYEIPYGVVKSKLVKDIDEIRIDKKINGIKEVRDQSDREGLSIMIEIENDANLDAILNYLLQKTEMQIYYSYNSIAIKNNAPKLMSLNDMLSSYLGHIKEVKNKEIIFDLAKFENKLEIVDGLIRVGDITDEVIRIIRASDNSKRGVIEELMKHFNFSEIQATAIAEMRLYRLSRIDQEMYIQEKKDLESKINLFKGLLNDESKFNDYLISILKEIKNNFPTPRKTEIKDEEFKIEINQEELIKNEEAYIGITTDGYIKKFSIRVFESNEIATYGLKEKDALVYLDQVETKNKLLIFTNLGNYIFLPLHKLEENKWKDVGRHLNDFVALKSDEKIINAILVKDFDAKTYINLVTKQGIGKKVLVKNFEVSRFNKTLNAIKLKDKEDRLIDVKISNNYNDIIIVTHEGKAVRYSEIEVPEYGTNSSGVKLISLAKDDYVVGFVMANAEDKMFLSTKKAQFKRLRVSDIDFTSKTTQGKYIFSQNKTSKFEVEQIKIIKPETKVLIFDSENNISFFETKEINISLKSEGFTNSKNKESYSTLIDIFDVVDSNKKTKEKTTSSKSVSKDTNLEKAVEEKEEISETQRIQKAQEKLKAIDDLDIDSLLDKFKL